MPFIEWTDEFNTGFEDVDEQHRHWVDILNKFEEASRRGKASRLMNAILNELIGYAHEHFSFEENKLHGLGYEDLNIHRAKHRQLIQKIERIQFDFNERHMRVTSEMRDLLKYWLTNHILVDDMEYARTLREAADAPDEAETGTGAAGDSETISSR